MVSGMATKIPGSRLPILISLISRIFRPIAQYQQAAGCTHFSNNDTGKEPPAVKPAPRVIAPWYKNTGIAAANTPIPIDEAKIIALCRLASI
jgi:hypothetical protein